MEIKTTIDGTSATVAPIGNLTVATAPSLEAAFAEIPGEVNDLTLDLAELEYVASAGLRVIVSQVKTVKRNGGKMIIANSNDEIMEVFDVTGLVEILDFA